MSSPSTPGPAAEAMGRLHVHFDAVGGVAGDMIVAALLDALPDLRDRVWADLAAVLPPEAGAPRLLNGITAGLRAVRFRLDGEPLKHDEIRSDQLALPSTLSREREKVAGDSRPDEGLRRDSIESHPVPGARSHAGTAGDYRDMRARIARARLAEGAADRALAILALIARVEAELHGVPIEEVQFHEIADWDSLADVVAIGSIAAALEDATYSVSDSAARGRPREDEARPFARSGTRHSRSSQGLHLAGRRDSWRARDADRRGGARPSRRPVSGRVPPREA